MVTPVAATFLGLPTKLRVRIYELIFTPAGPITDKAVFKTQGSQNLNLLRTCKQVYKEAKVIAFQRTVFITGQYEYDSILQHMLAIDDEQWQAIQYVTLATHWNKDLTDNYYGGSFGTDLSPAITNFLWNALDIFVGAKHIVLFNRGSRKLDFKAYLHIFVSRSYSKQLGTNPHGWRIVDHPENESRYTLESVNTDRVVIVEYANAWSSSAGRANSQTTTPIRHHAPRNIYQAPELRGRLTT